MMRDPAELDGTAGATQSILPSPPQLTSLYICHLPYCPCHKVAPVRQPHGSSRCQSELRHNHSPLIPIPSTLTCLPYIHPPIIQGSLYSLHPLKPRLSFNYTSFEYIHINFSLTNKLYKFMVLYRPPPKTNFNNFINEFYGLMSSLFDENRKVHACGDFNIWTEDIDNYTKDFWKSLETLITRMWYVNLLPGLDIYLMR